MISRREFLQAGVAAAAILGPGLGRLARAQALDLEALTAFETMGNVTLIHVTDIHAQARPVFFREPDTNIGVGARAGKPPHVTGRAFLDEMGWGGENYDYVVDVGSRAGIEFGVYGIPETFIVDARGIITGKITGPATGPALRAALEEAFAAGG